MEKKTPIYLIKPEKKFYLLRLLMVFIVFGILIYSQLIISMTFIFTIFIGIILIPFSGLLIYIFYINFYKKPLNNKMILERDYIRIYTFTMQKTHYIKFNLKRLKNILIFQSFSEKIIGRNTISMNIQYDVDKQISFLHVNFDKPTLVFLKKLYRKCNLQKHDVIIDFKLNRYFTDILSKILK
ncbi:MAG: hypothetical protein ACTSVY_10550 [Candidatus Helarchaeota archaeon]